MMSGRPCAKVRQIKIKGGTKMNLNSNGTNAAIKAHILSDEKMREIGFTDHMPKNWYYCKTIARDITFNITIPKDGSDIEIITLDENFCQPYDYQYMLKNNPHFQFALQVKERVEQIMSYLQSVGVLSGHEYGDYI